MAETEIKLTVEQGELLCDLAEAIMNKDIPKINEVLAKGADVNLMANCVKAEGTGQRFSVEYHGGLMRLNPLLLSPLVALTRVDVKKRKEILELLMGAGLDLWLNLRVVAMENKGCIDQALKEFMPHLTQENKVTLAKQVLLDKDPPALIFLINEGLLDVNARLCGYPLITEVFLVTRDDDVLRLNLLKFLVEHGANPDERIRDGRKGNTITLLMEALQKGRYVLANCLLDLGADAKAKSQRGVTTLMELTAHDPQPNQFEIIRRLEALTLRLLLAGADPNAMMDGGKTVKDLTEPGDCGFRAMERALQQAHEKDPTIPKKFLPGKEIEPMEKPVEIQIPEPVVACKPAVETPKVDIPVPVGIPALKETAVVPVAPQAEPPKPIEKVENPAGGEAIIDPYAHPYAQLAAKVKEEEAAKKAREEAEVRKKLEAQKRAEAEARAKAEAAAKAKRVAMAGELLATKITPPKTKFRVFCEKNLPTFTRGFDGVRRLCH